MSMTDEGMAKVKYAIVTTSRKNGEPLFMVDRSQGAPSFWSNRPHCAMLWTSKDAAEVQAAKLKFNDPRVVEISQKEIETSQMYEDEDDDMYATTAGWDEGGWLNCNE